MISITRDNVEELLDQGQLYAQTTSGRWWRVRRNGKTRRWKLNPERLEIPVKAGLKAYGLIIHTHFDESGKVNNDYFRHIDDVPKKLRP